MTNEYIDYITQHLTSNRLSIANLSDGTTLQSLVDTSTLEGKNRMWRGQLYDTARALLNKEKEQHVSLASVYKPHTIPPVSSLYANPPKYMDEAIGYFIWQVKRKALGLPIATPVALIFYGSIQQVGKSGLVKRLLGIHDICPDNIIHKSLVAETAIDKLGDPNEYQELASSLVLFCDELENARKAQRESIKKWITANRIQYRAMYTTTRPSVTNRSTIIGTTNHPIEDILRDDTGMRRYWQLELNERPIGADEEDWSAFDAYPWKELWESIDPNTEHPGQAIVQARKHEVVLESSVDAWLDTLPAPQEVMWGHSDGYQITDLHKHYLQFCKGDGFREPLVWKALKQDLISKGWTCKKSGSIRRMVAPVGGI